MSRTLGIVALAIGFGVVGFCLALMTGAYTRCPFWDEWVVVRDIGAGRYHSLGWFWSQQNEHRIFIPRLLIAADLFLFHGQNISLFAEIALVQLVNLALLSYAIEVQKEVPGFLKRTMEGLFAFSLFHPNQVENFTWAYQVGFVLPFAFSTIALTAVAYYGRWRHPRFTLGFAPFGSLLAGMNLAGGLLVGPVLVLCALIKRLPARYLAWIVGVTVVSTTFYLWDYRRIGTDLSFLDALEHTKDIFVYVLTYLGASWTAILPHKERLMAFISLACLFIVSIHSLRTRQPSDLESLLLAQCFLIVALALLTAMGRIQFGVGQAFASRYQTPAMIFWASLGSLLLLQTYNLRPKKINYVQAAVILVMLASVATFPKTWLRTMTRAHTLGAACRAVMGPDFDEQQARKLYEYPAVVKEARPFLRRVWGWSGN